VPVFFEFLEKINAPFYAFHDRDVAPHGRTLAESNKSLDAVVKLLKEEQKRTGVKLLWGTAQLFVHPRFMHGAATSCNSDVFAFAAAQVKKAMEVTHELGGEGYVFWGGREGYTTLLNTNLKREMDHLGKFLHMAVDYKKAIGFKGPFYIEPKPKEPTKHQYDSDAAACLNFLREYDLLDTFKLNLETNHATLAGHTMQHELEVAAAACALGSIDANTGDVLLGWDTDQFPTDLYLTTQVMLTILKYGGFTTGGTNFDAKVRRESFEPVDLFHAHIAGMDTFARGLKIAAAIRQDGRLADFIRQRYSSWDSGIGEKIEKGKVGFEELEAYMLKKGEAAPNDSGRQEYLENLINEFI
jgi:xylose isomerase